MSGCLPWLKLSAQRTARNGSGVVLVPFQLWIEIRFGLFLFLLSTLSARRERGVVRRCNSLVRAMYGLRAGYLRVGFGFSLGKEREEESGPLATRDKWHVDSLSTYADH